MTDFELLDSSVWIAYLFEARHREIIEAEKVFLLSTLSIFEIKKKLLEKGVSASSIAEKLQFVKSKSFLIEPDELITELAAEISVKDKIPAIDSLIYATAVRNDAELITQDNDFKRLDKVRIVGDY